MAALQWDHEKNKKLRRDRGVSFEEAATLILKGHYAVQVQVRSRKPQRRFIVTLNGYTHVIPFVIDDDGNIFLKTIYPSRKQHRLHGKELQ